MEFIRNFSIIAHIDHGKSTLADCLIRRCGGLSDREMAEQVLDNMDLERERGITIKAQTASLAYRAPDGSDYVLNLIDTPGHVDFSYEVSRSLAACEGALLVVDASQGVEAQTIANCTTAVGLDLTVIPVLNKIDLDAADPDRVAREIEDIIGIDATGAIEVSAKRRSGIEELLERIVSDVPPPRGSVDAPLQALVSDSWFDRYAGVVILVRLVNGRLSRRDRIRLLSTGAELEVGEIGVFTPKATPREELLAGEVGYVIAGIKEIRHARVGDTLVHAGAQGAAAAALPGFSEARPQVFASVYPAEVSAYGQLRTAVEKLRLNDAAFSFEPEVSPAFGSGFRCGFLGLLHMEIVQERLEREFGVDSILASPSVGHEVVRKDGTAMVVTSATDLPPPEDVSEIREPIASMMVLCPHDQIGRVIELCTRSRARQVSVEYGDRQVLSTWEIPMSEIIGGFVDDLKSATRGYGSMEYELARYEPSKIVRVDLLINGERADALSVLTRAAGAAAVGRGIAERVSKAIPRQMFDVAVQAAIGGKIIARETVKALRKNVLAKCYGGDVTRKRKLIEKQKKGKKRMRRLGNVELPQEAFLAAMRAGRK